ncbi:MAG TPA: DUF2442 domain-containing protein [Planctomycetes bacterium]|nr:DUF2442 domain-containing protein [Planctomycetota bacterium]
MTSETRGASISDVEVTSIDTHGVWVYVRGTEHFLPYRDFPWFKDATLAEVLQVELMHGTHLVWERLDVDLSLASLEDPGKYPLVAK